MYSRQADIQQGNIDMDMFLPRQADCVIALDSQQHAVGGGRQDRLDDHDHRGIIVHNENSATIAATCY